MRWLSQPWGSPGLCRLLYQGDFARLCHQPSWPSFNVSHPRWSGCAMSPPLMMVSRDR